MLIKTNLFLPLGLSGRARTNDFFFQPRSSATWAQKPFSNAKDIFCLSLLSLLSKHLVSRRKRKIANLEKTNENLKWFWQFPFSPAHTHSQTHTHTLTHSHTTILMLSLALTLSLSQTNTLILKLTLARIQTTNALLSHTSYFSARVCSISWSVIH